MTVKDLIQMDIDIDVYDDVCEELSIAFCGPQQLTPEGQKAFAEVMDYKIDFVNGSYGFVAIVKIDDQDEAVWTKRLNKAKRFFYAAAGYCSCDDYDKWFEEVE
jgi:hypothetical protein